MTYACLRMPYGHRTDIDAQGLFLLQNISSRMFSVLMQVPIALLVLNDGLSKDFDTIVRSLVDHQ